MPSPGPLLPDENPPRRYDTCEKYATREEDYFRRLRGFERYGGRLHDGVDGCGLLDLGPGQLELLGRLIDEYRVDAVVEITLQACHTYNVETLGIKRFVNEVKGIPYMAVETDYSTADIGQLNTRMAAFIEML